MIKNPFLLHRDLEAGIPICDHRISGPMARRAIRVEIRANPVFCRKQWVRGGGEHRKLHRRGRSSVQITRAMKELDLILPAGWSSSVELRCVETKRKAGRGTMAGFAFEPAWIMPHLVSN